ncbi:MAG: right-handed parallel beta-helix repeat-containing protein [Prevotella sp.]|nr:right-handed parallel beta-helix repeat-containing protein [Prevotella sp.]
MRPQTFILTMLALVIANASMAVVRYAAPKGTDPEGLSPESPGSLKAMVDTLKAGDTLYLADGQYNLKKTLVVNISGKADKWATICPMSGARPVIDFRKQPNGTNGIKVSGHFIHIRGITIRYAGKKGIWLENASHCILENLDVYGCCDSGIQLRKGGYNTVVNCDSHDNFDYQDNGVNADGFADKQGGAPFPGNTYIGCRAWNNSDDGWDSFQRESKDTPTVYLYCVTYNNGPAHFDLSSHPRANGVDSTLTCMKGKDFAHFPNGGNPNGFKLGGQGKDNKASGNYTRHDTELRHCLAVGHRKKGFDQNNNAGHMAISHCLAIGNEINYGFGNPFPCTLDISYCISISPTSGEHLATAAETTVTQADNSWNTGWTGNQGFAIPDTPAIVKLLLSPRQPSGALPEALLNILKNL